MDASLAGFDLFALLVLFASGVMALVRGFVRESLTIAGFVVGALVALWTWPITGAIANEFINSSLIAYGVALSVVFLVIYLAVSFVTSNLQKTVRKSEEVNVIDRTAGFAFGLVRGVFVLGFVVLLFKIATPEAQPDWLRGSRVYPLANATANLLQAIAPEGSLADSNSSEDLEDDPIGRLIERTNEDR